MIKLNKSCLHNRKKLRKILLVLRARIYLPLRLMCVLSKTYLVRFYGIYGI